MNVVPTLMCGGTERQVMTLCRSLDPRRFDLEFACLRRLGPFVKEIDDRRLPLAEYPLTSFRSVTALRQQMKFARLCVAAARRHRARLQLLRKRVRDPARAAGSRPVVIASIRDLGLYLTPLQKRVQRYVCRLADCVVVNAEAVKDWLVGEGYDAAKIVVIHNGVDLTRFSEPAQPDRVRQEFGLPPGVPLVAVVSRLSRLKGLEQFLEAAAVVGRRSRIAISGRRRDAPARSVRISISSRNWPPGWASAIG